MGQETLVHGGIGLRAAMRGVANLHNAVRMVSNAEPSMSGEVDGKPIVTAKIQSNRG